MKTPASTLLISLVVASLVAVSALAGPPTKRKIRYLRSCWQCHGVEARGDGPASSALKVPVPSLREDRGKSRDDLVALIREGRGAMPAYFDSISKPNSRRILVYIDSLDKKKSPKDEKDEEDEDEVPVEERNAPAEEDEVPVEEGNAPVEEGDAPANEAEGGE